MPDDLAPASPPLLEEIWRRITILEHRLARVERRASSESEELDVRDPDGATKAALERKPRMREGVSFTDSGDPK